MAGKFFSDRRQFLKSSGLSLLWVSALATGLFTPAHAQQVDKVANPTDLKPGQWIWHPETSPDGPVSIIVSLPEQLCYVYRNGELIALSTVSSGRPGYRTPTGVFTILAKQTDHYSKEYKADMPDSEFITTTGVALHAGGLPGYPSSHGCVHLPLAFAKLLYTITRDGTPVVVTNSKAQPPKMLPPSGAALKKSAAAEPSKPEDKPKPPASTPAPAATGGIPVSGNTTAVIISRADQSITVLEWGQVIAQGKAFIKDPDQPFGNHLFILEKNDNSNLTWHEISYTNGSEPATAADASLIQRVEATAEVAEVMKEKMQPGMLMVMTDEPAKDDTRTSDGKTIIFDQDPDKG